MATTTTMMAARPFPTSASRRVSTLTAAAAAICLCFSCIGSIDAFIVPTSPSSQLPPSQSFSSSSYDGGIGSKSSSSSSLGLFSSGDNAASKSRRSNKKGQGKNKEEDDDLLSLSRTSLQSSTLKLFNNKININPFYGTLWLGFLMYGIIFSPGEMLNPADTQIIEQLISNPTNSAASTGEMINPLFFMVFNGLGLVPLVMAQLVVPQSALVATSSSFSSSSKDGESGSGSGGGLSSVPFVLGSFAAGFGSLGLYLTFRNPPPPILENTSDVKDEKLLLTLEETSWFTRNVLESKFFAVSVVLILSSLFVTSGLFTTSSSLSFTDIVDGYQQLASTSKLATVSSVDLMILTVTAATLIPSDYKLRTQRTGGNVDAVSGIDGTDLTEQQINLLAASTALLPVIGAAIYCALRPSLPSSDSSES
mmetsp:Transcript_28304/g.68858  ORF Transcript_28304/g.68858 Transcript_28304/m.68858 type:complete len:422 (+) Transcript_28304:221-1486(+)